ICPKRQNLICGKMPKRQGARMVIVDKQPCKPAAQGFFCGVLECACKCTVQILSQYLRVVRTICRNGKGISQQVIHFLVNHLCILIVDDVMIWQIVNDHKLTILAQSCPLALQDIMLPMIIPPTVYLFPALRRMQPCRNLSGEKQWAFFNLPKS